jgi:phosphonate transport system ATP-binding protein
VDGLSDGKPDDGVCAVETRAASKTFTDRKALDGVSLAIRPGEMVALIGPSGSGKSTLLRGLAGLMPFDAGSGPTTAAGLALQSDGRFDGKVRDARARIGFVAQQFNLVGRLSLFANVMIGALGRLPAWKGALGLFPQQDRLAAMRALDRVGMAEYAGRRASTLSGGQQQRGAIARALMQGAQVLFADEPIASLDPVSARRVMELLSDLNRTEGLTVVVSLHQVDYAQRWCRRVVALKAGRIVYDGPPDGLERDALVDIYGADIEEVFWDQGAAA